MTTEKWKWIPGYKNYYKVSTYGRVKSTKRTFIDCTGRWRTLQERILKQCRTRKRTKHLQVGLSKNGKLKIYPVHYLVLTTFVGPRPKGKQARHYPDGNPENNRLSNLSWSDQGRNELDKQVHQTYRSRKATVGTIKKIRRLHKSGKYSIQELAEKFGYKWSGSIRAIVSKENWKFVK